MHGHLNVKLFNKYLVLFRLKTLHSGSVTCRGILSEKEDNFTFVVFVEGGNKKQY